MPVCLSVSVSCLLLSSSSHCVVSTSEKRGTKKSLPLQSQNLSKTSFDYRFLHAPACPFRLSSRLALSSSGPVELLSPYQPNHTPVAAASRPLRIVSRPRRERAGGSPPVRDTGVFLQSGGSKTVLWGLCTPYCHILDRTYQRWTNLI